mgnify:CR=1 FL=1
MANLLLTTEFGQMSDIEKIEAVLKAASEVELNLDSEHARKILAERIKNALDKDDTNSTMEGQLTFNFAIHGIDYT